MFKGKLTRRELLTGGVAMAVVGRNAELLIADPSQTRTPVNFKVPIGACDSHTHVFCDPRYYPFWSERTYTPETAPLAEMVTLHRALHIERTVIVNSLVYGTDNSCMVDALRKLSRSARGIALLDENASRNQIDSLDKVGVRGIRLNFVDFGVPDPTIVRRRFRSALKQIEGRGWHVQINAGLGTVETLQNELVSAKLPVVFDHFAGAKASLGVSQPGFDTLVKLLRTDKVYVKVSAPYRISNKMPLYSDVKPLAEALIRSNPERILWGSDWPHPDSSRVPGRRGTDVAPLLQIDDGLALNQLAIWAPDDNIRRKILVENPAKLYGF